MECIDNIEDIKDIKDIKDFDGIIKNISRLKNIETIFKPMLKEMLPVIKELYAEYFDEPDMAHRMTKIDVKNGKPPIKCMVARMVYMLEPYLSENKAKFNFDLNSSYMIFNVKKYRKLLESTFMHEILHMLSCNADNEKNILYVGFLKKIHTGNLINNKLQWNIQYGEALNEGMTELLAKEAYEKLYNKPYPMTEDYQIPYVVAKFLRHIMGEDLVKSYFQDATIAEQKFDSMIGRKGAWREFNEQFDYLHNTEYKDIEQMKQLESNVLCEYYKEIQKRKIQEGKYTNLGALKRETEIVKEILNIELLPKLKENAQIKEKSLLGHMGDKFENCNKEIKNCYSEKSYGYNKKISYKSINLGNERIKLKDVTQLQLRQVAEQVL